MRKDLLRRHWFEIILLVVVIGVHLFAATSDAVNFPSAWFTRDDAYYYFKVAQNISEGHGSTFDGINLTNGYHPLWMLVNIPIFALARYDLILPLRIMLLLQAALSAGTGVLIYRIARAAISEPAGVMAASWWVFSPYIHATMYEFGLETALASFAVALLLHRLYRFELAWRVQSATLKDVTGLALLAVFALFSRLDLVFLAILAGPWIILRGTSMRILMPLDAVLATGAVFASFILKLGLPEYYVYANAAIAMAGISVATRLVLYFLLGLYQPVRERPPALTARQIAMAVSLSSALTGGIMLALAPLTGSFPRAALLWDWLLNLVGVLALRGLWHLFGSETHRDAAPALEFIKNRWQTWLREGAIYYAMLVVPLAAYMLFNKLGIGSALPVSGQIKRWWGIDAGARSSLDFWALGPGLEFNAWMPLSGWLGALGRHARSWTGMGGSDQVFAALLVTTCLAWTAMLLINRKLARRSAVLASLPLLLSSSVVQVLSYNAGGYAAMKEWYWITEPLLLVLAGGTAAWIVARPLWKVPAGRLALWILVGGASLWMAGSFTRLVMLRMPHGFQPAGADYMDSATFLEQSTPPGSLIGMTGGGNVGYYISGRTIINMDGLINSPAYFEALKKQAGGRYMQSIGLDYIFANRTILAGTPYYGQYKTGRRLGRFGGKVLMEFSP